MTNNEPVLITYWHDDDVDTICTVCFANEAEAAEFENFLESIDYYVIEHKSAKVIPVKEAIKNIKSYLC